MINLVWYVVSFWLLAFSVKIGITLFFSLTGMVEVELAFALKNIELPNALMVESIANKRLSYYVTVEEDGAYRVGKVYFEPEQLQKHLTNVYRGLPNVIICIIADKNCKMEAISNLIAILRKSRTQRVSFFCKKINKDPAYKFVNTDY